MTVTHSKVHEYLRMTLHFSIPSKIIVQMDDYVKVILNEASVDMDGVVLILVVEHLFEVSKDAECLVTKQAKPFHHLMAEPLFLCKHARLDL